MSEAISKAVNPVTEQDREKKIAEIREALEKATPGPWFCLQSASNQWTVEASNGVGFIGKVIVTVNNENDARLIANAPEWLQFLLSEIDRLKEERDKLIKALKFYANEDNWRSSRFVLGRAEADGGERAQAVLDEIGVNGK